MDCWEAIQELFEQAVSRPPGQRDAWLDQCAQPDEIISEVRQMLRAHEGPALGIESALHDNSADATNTPECIGPWKVSRPLGEGGMGTVFLCERADGAFERQVAIKVVARRLPGTNVGQRFARERQIHAQLQHPNIAPLLDAGTTANGTQYLVMEYVPGIPITRAADRHPCDEERLVHLLFRVCDAVAFAHSRMVLHRDLKPSNILVTQDDDVRLLDFGIAKLLDPEPSNDLTQTCAQPMTPAYASPEQLAGEELGTASDVFSLGVLMYELLTGVRPFTGKTLSDQRRSVLETRPPLAPLQKGRGSRVSADLRAICLRALESRPEDRYPTAAAMADDLRRYLDNEPVKAREPTVFHRIVKFCRRHPIGVPMAVTGFLSLAIALGAALYQARIAETERDMARAERDRAKEVTEVLTDLFDSDPYAESDERRDSMSLREFLTRRAERIHDEFDDNPLLKASLYDLLANLYVNISLYPQATPLAEESLALRQALLTRNHPDVGKSMATLGALRVHQGHYEAAELLFRSALAIAEYNYPEPHPALAEAISNLSFALFARNERESFDEQIALDRRSLEMRRSLFGNRSVQAAESLNGLASVLLQRALPGDVEEAEVLFRDALDIRSQVLGLSHPSTANTLSNLANLLDDAGRLAESEALFRQALETNRRIFGPNHVRVGDTLYGLGHVLEDQERWEDAYATFAAAHEAYAATLPADHPYLTDCLDKMSRVITQSGLIAETANESS